MKRGNRYVVLIGMGLIFVPLLAVWAQGPIRDKIFLTKVMTSSQAEIKYSRLAEKNSNSLRVKAFATRQIVQHEKFNEQLEAIARRLDVKVPQELERDQSAVIDSLSKLSGAEFDRNYLNRIIEDREKGLKAFQEELDKGNSEELKKLCSEALPHMQRDLKRARRLMEVVSRK